MASEQDFLDWLRSRAAPEAGVPIPVGDDLAGLDFPDDLLLVGVDQVLDGVHLDLSRHGYVAAGRKAVNRNLSDCAAMACLPVAVVASAAMPRSASLDDLKALHAGLTEAGAAFGCRLVGGDTGSWGGPFCVSVTVLGRPAGVRPVPRGGARAGDDLYVSGPLGGSLFETADHPPRHLTFVPRIELARRLAGLGISAMMDLSDGLSADLPRLCAAGGVGAEVEAEVVPIHTDAVAMSRDSGRPPLEHALHDGEDYELLFTAPPATRPAVEACGGVVRIGRVVAGGGVRIGRSGAFIPMGARGWDHALSQPEAEAPVLGMRGPQSIAKFPRDEPG